jgi:tetratricopeptide (TPR) repeat protein
MSLATRRREISGLFVRTLQGTGRVRNRQSPLPASTLAPLTRAAEGSLTEPTMLPVPIVVRAGSGLPWLNRNQTIQSVKARIRLCFPAVSQLTRRIWKRCFGSLTFKLCLWRSKGHLSRKRHPLAHFFFASCLADIGKYEQAIQEGQKGQLLEGASPEQAAAMATEFLKAFRTGGPNGYWQKNLELTRKYEQVGIGALELAGAYARVGDKEKAFEWLEKSYEEKVGDITLIKYLPDFKSLRGDPRFSALLKRIGLPD